MKAAIVAMVLSGHADVAFMTSSGIQVAIVADAGHSMGLEDPHGLAKALWQATLEPFDQDKHGAVSEQPPPKGLEGNAAKSAVRLRRSGLPDPEKVLTTAFVPSRPVVSLRKTARSGRVDQAFPVENPTNDSRLGNRPVLVVHDVHVGDGLPCRAMSNAGLCLEICSFGRLEVCNIQL